MQKINRKWIYTVLGTLASFVLLIIFVNMSSDNKLQRNASEIRNPITASKNWTDIAKILGENNQWSMIFFECPMADRYILRTADHPQLRLVNRKKESGTSDSYLPINNLMDSSVMRQVSACSHLRVQIRSNAMPTWASFDINLNSDMNISSVTEISLHD